MCLPCITYDLEETKKHLDQEYLLSLKMDSKKFKQIFINVFRYEFSLLRKFRRAWVMLKKISILNCLLLTIRSVSYKINIVEI